MSVAFLVLALLALPLPGVPALPPGSELRVTSPDLRAVYLALRVTEKGLVVKQSGELKPGQPVALVVRVGKEVKVFPGRAARGDIVLLFPEGEVSLRETLEKIYRLTWPEVLGGPHPGDRRRP